MKKPARNILLLLASVLAVVSTPADAIAEPSIQTRTGEGHGHVELLADPGLTLQEAVALTAEHEPGSAALEARREEATALGRDARRLLAGAPSLVVGGLHDGPFDNDGYRQWDAALQLPLWWPGQRRGRRRAAEAAEAASRHAVQAHRLEVAGWVRSAISDLALARLRLDLAESAWQMEEALVSQVQRAVELGEVARTDLLLAQSARLDRRLEYLEALEEARHAEAEYALLTGLSRWPDRWDERPADPSSFADHPFLLLAAEEVERTEGELERVVGDQWSPPLLALGTQHERETRRDDYSDRIMVGLQVPVGRRADARSAVASLRRRVSELRRDAQRLERDLRGRLAMTQHAHELADQRVATATEQASIAAEALRLSDLGFALGEIDLQSLLRARTRARRAEQTRLEALLLQQASAARLNQALGVLP